MRSNGSIAWDYLDGCVIVAHRAGPIVDADFGEFLADVKAQPDVRRVVVRASDGAPGAAHRTELRHWYAKNSVRGSVLTDSIIARGGVTALSWFGIPIRAFALHEIEAALDFVEVRIQDRAEASRKFRDIVAAADR
jgi:hypothetical protein